MTGLWRGYFPQIYEEPCALMSRVHSGRVTGCNTIESKRNLVKKYWLNGVEETAAN